MVKTLSEFQTKHNIEFITKKPEETEFLIDLLINENKSLINEEEDDSFKMINYAIYYFYIDKNDIKAISILKKVIDKEDLYLFIAHLYLISMYYKKRLNFSNEIKNFESKYKDTIDLITENEDFDNKQLKDIISRIFILFGFYYTDISVSETLAIKYYSKAIKLGNKKSYYHIGRLYNYFKRYDDMTLYYLLSIENGYFKPCYYLGMYYQSIINDMTTANYYFKMGATNGCVKSMIKLGDYYRDLNLKQKKEARTYCELYTKDMEKYYLMAIEKNNIEAMISLGNFYMTMGYDEKNKVKGEKYLLMAAHEKVKELIG